MAGSGLSWLVSWICLKRFRGCHPDTPWRTQPSDQAERETDRADVGEGREGHGKWRKILQWKKERRCKRQGSRNNYEFLISNLDLAVAAQLLVDDCSQARTRDVGAPTGSSAQHSPCARSSPCAALWLSWLFDIKIDSCRRLFSNYCLLMAETMLIPGLSAQIWIGSISNPLLTPALPSCLVYQQSLLVHTSPISLPSGRQSVCM